MRLLINTRPRTGAFLLAALLSSVAMLASAQVVEPVMALAKKEKAPLIETLRELTGIESGSGDLEGLAKIADVIASRLRALGGEVQLVDVNDGIYRMADTPPAVGKVVRATFKGTGTKKIMLIAHMDTVYLKGMGAQQPFRIDGDRAYGLGIADDKHGVAVILHAVKMLQELGFREYGTLTVLINGDEEISSPGARKLITRLGAEHDATLSFEGGGTGPDTLALTTAGIAAAVINVKGRASHAGAAPEKGVNALYELAHQIMQLRDLSDSATGVKVNWTVAKSGANRNVIPADAQTVADIRVLRVMDYDGIEKKLQERIKNQLLPEAKVELVFERRRPPLEPNPASRALARLGQGVMGEIGIPMAVSDQAGGGGTDAAFAALEGKSAVVERFGLKGAGAHSNEHEYILISSIEPRLYLATRMVMEIARGKLK